MQDDDTIYNLKSVIVVVQEGSVSRTDMGDVSEEEILRTIRSYRQERRMREITIAAES